jgi:ArsR family transcriptional regulator
MRMEPNGDIIARLGSLADATRARLLLALERNELTVGELRQVLQLPQSTVSRHLKTLAGDGWVASRAEGPSRRYRMAALSAPERRLWSVVRDQLRDTPAARQDAHRIAGVLAQRRTTSEEFFAGAAGQWDALRAELFGQRADLHALLGLLDEQWTIGDLGCGTGQVSETLAPFVRRVVAVDASRAMLSAARKRLHGIRNVELRAGTLESLPAQRGELDAAILSLVLHYTVDPTAVLAEAARGLRTGGKLLIIDMLPHDREEYRVRMGHIWLGFEREQLTEWLREAGFDQIRHHALPADPAAKGPTLFVASARRTVTKASESRDSARRARPKRGEQQSHRSTKNVITPRARPASTPQPDRSR